MWKGTADILNANPTKIKTIPKVKPSWVESTFSEIVIKFVEPVNPLHSLGAPKLSNAKQKVKLKK